MGHGRRWDQAEGHSNNCRLLALLVCAFRMFARSLAVMIALKLLKTKGAVLDDDERQQRRRQINRHIGKMIVVCISVNTVIYFFVILYLLASGFNRGGKCSDGVCGDWYWSKM